MSTPPKRRERSLSDVKASVVSVPPKVRTATFTEKKKSIRSVLQVKPKISGDDQTQEDKPHKSVLNLVEALMKETQRLKDAVKQQAKKQQLTTQYLSTIHQTHQTQIKTLSTKLNQSEQNRHQLFTNIAKILEQCETKRVYSQTSGKVNQVSFTTEQINALNGLLSEAESVSFDIEKDFAEFPSFDDWVTAQTNRDTENSEDEVELRPEGEETEEIEVLPETTEEEAPNPDDCSLEHIEIQTGLMPLEPRVNGYRIENGNLNYFDATTVQPELFNGLIESNKDIPYYRSFYYGKPHTNYIVEDPNQGIFFISILGEGAVKEVSKSFGTIVRHEGGLVVGPRLRRKKIIQNFNISPNATWKEIKDSSFSAQLQDLEIKDLKVRHRNKFALLYVKEGQNQEEMFSNTDGSEDWEEFLEFLGDKVPLKGWKKYNGGLDTETGTTGTHSIYLQYCGVEVMFHVSTMIPVSESDEQQVERKRHLGNDVVVLVFKEGKDPFSPTIIRSHFNSIFIVVQKYHNPQDEENTYYQLAVASREIVEPFPPFLPESPVFKKNKALRNFLICKMINGERQTYQTSEFSSRLGRARTGVMKAVAKDYLKGK